jgi:hypothetical protein
MLIIVIKKGECKMPNVCGSSKYPCTVRWEKFNLKGERRYGLRRKNLNPCTYIDELGFVPGSWQAQVYRSGGRLVFNLLPATSTVRISPESKQLVVGFSDCD